MSQFVPQPFPATSNDTLYMAKTIRTGPKQPDHYSSKTIQLIEVPAPPRVHCPYASSFIGSPLTSSFSSSTGELSEDSACSSYCSSGSESETQSQSLVPMHETRLHRILAWREQLVHTTMEDVLLMDLLLPLECKSYRTEDQVDANKSRTKYTVLPVRYPSRALVSGWTLIQFMHSVTFTQTYNPQFPVRLEIELALA
ncbi:uncharacterized protein LAESUDRAFT_712967 [Laetiporus sulphureus 93-53]|uniref:Uncharacterized protein n=1 Tax=Laetiporus sulphureus 93-53 TaxID=1314785 RepID=A0A165F659_9APHY|nr:uncharacterized protein LAESUDRAFT_712967 [Laetiporus sulphureus 93-53]KZT08469.1 hypothetical protein LAESUDRAFT_712967 [Laetiporus sulphureus 93-53]